MHNSSPEPTSNIWRLVAVNIRFDPLQMIVVGKVCNGMTICFLPKVDEHIHVFLLFFRQKWMGLSYFFLQIKSLDIERTFLVFFDSLNTVFMIPFEHLLRKSRLCFDRSFNMRRNHNPMFRRFYVFNVLVI